MQEELDFALEIFKVAYQKRKFEGPYVSPVPRDTALCCWSSAAVVIVLQAYSRPALTRQRRRVPAPDR